MLSVLELRRGEIAAAARHLACRPAPGPQFAGLHARPASTAAQALVTEAEEGPAAALGQVRRMCADLGDRPGLLLGDPALAAWLARTALAAGGSELAARAARAAQILADANPGFPALAAAAAHSHGLVRHDPVRLAEAAAGYPDLWARASAAEDLGVLYRGQGDRDQAIHHLKDALDGYGQAGADRDQARVRRRLRRLGIRQRHWATSAARPVTGWASLTGTEQAVAHFVAEGLNNGQVAARMYISPHTVAHHLRQAFRKLSIASRVELARIVIEGAAADTTTSSDDAGGPSRDDADPVAKLGRERNWRHGGTQLTTNRRRRTEMTVAWDQVTHDHVVRALEEYDRLGPDAFFSAHGFAPTTTYDLIWDERGYPPKAILGTAYELATGQRLASADFEGGKSGAVKVLGKLGFTVRPRRPAGPG